MKALILLGGFGTRLRPFTCQTPKPLLPILNQPFITYQLNLLKKYGIKEVTFCLSYKAEQFNKFVGTGKNFGLKVNYVYEDKPLGTGGAIKNAEKYFDETTIILNGDILTDINISEIMKFHNNKKAVLTISLIRVKDPTIYGLVETDKNQRIEKFLEKPSWDEVTCNTINGGIYIFEPELLSYIPPNINYSVERGLFPMLLEQKKNVYGYISNPYWIDIGTVEKYKQTHFDILNCNVNVPVPGKKLRNNVWVKNKASIDKTSTLTGKIVLGKNTKIEQFVQLSGCVSIGCNCIIRKGSQIIDSIILDNTVIEEGVKIENSLIGNNCKIESNSIINSGNALGDKTHLTKFSNI
ncbi:MAG: hypothetical protein A2252_08405 [Elusimicrobia bacterium RIFOXYA2_FULL_39_19]|nr:MAG: hypothetical protein A2252_08405 [Elusimicrobia bacterium RIFOXYA2_FULL_39_19]